VGSGKGGVGKTMVSLGLAYSLVNLGRRVLLVDADLGLANVDLQAGVDPRFTLQDVLFGACALAEAVIRIRQGPDILAAASGAPEMVDLGSARRRLFVEDLVRFAAGYEFVIIDVGAGIGQNVTAFLAAAPEVLVVVANEPTSLMDAYALIKTMARQPDPPALAAVVNMVRSQEEGLLLGNRVNAIARQHLGLDLRVAGVIPYDRLVPDAIRARRSIALFAPQSPPALALAALARDIASGRGRPTAGWKPQDRMLEQLVALGGPAGPVEVGG
jgi:flagellar biosynthesis protein FlhG